jgi:hypothetical protein
MHCVLAVIGVHTCKNPSFSVIGAMSKNVSKCQFFAPSSSVAPAITDMGLPRRLVANGNISLPLSAIISQNLSNP